MVRALDQHWDSEAGGFFDRAADAPSDGRASTFAASRCRILPSSAGKRHRRDGARSFAAYIQMTRSIAIAPRQL